MFVPNHQLWPWGVWNLKTSDEHVLIFRSQSPSSLLRIPLYSLLWTRAFFHLTRFSLWAVDTLMLDLPLGCIDFILKFICILPFCWWKCSKSWRKKKKKKDFLLGRKAKTNLDSILKSRDITLPTKVCLVKAMVFPVVVYGCESCTIKKTKCWKLMFLNCGVGEDSWESLGLQDQTSQL